MSEVYLKKDPNDETKTIEVTVFKAFESEDEFNKYAQSVSSKAKGEILKEIGANNVAEIKDTLGKVKGYTELETNYKALEGSFTALKGEHEKTMDELIATKYGIHEGFKTEFITLAKAGVTDKVTLLQSAEAVAKKLSTVLGTQGKVQIGGQPGGTMTPEQQQVAKMREAAGLK